MIKYCENCKGFHDENELCPKYKEQLKKHPEWFDEMVQTMATASIATPIVQKYGTAIKEHLVAHNGIDNQTGQQLTRSLKSISKQQTNPNYEYQNLKQRAGFAAEVQETARRNATRAINGETGRVARYDDVGQTNHPLYDLVEVDAGGNIIEGTGVQMKFIGGTPKACWNKIISTQCDKYVKSNTPIQVPSDYYEKMLEIADEQIKKLTNQYETLISNGEHAKANIIKTRIKHCEKAKSLILKSEVSTHESVYAVKHPEKYTAKQILENANAAGLEAAQTGALVGGSISLVRNVVLLKNGDIKADVAIKNIALDTAKGAIGGYVVGAGGAALKGVMQNSSFQTVRTLSETQFPSGAIALAYGITKSAITNFIKYKNGQISKTEMTRSFAKDAVRSSLVTCSLAMLAFPPTAAGTAATMGIAIYLDSVCANVLDEVFGEGLYEQILNSSGYITATAQNAVELLQQFKKNVQLTEKYNCSSKKELSNIQRNRIELDTKAEKTKKLLGDL